MPDETTTLDPTSFTVRLTGWQPWEDAARSAKALLFGHIVKLVTPITKEYLSDLFDDARWIDNNVDCTNGPFSFDFLIRHSGTNIAGTAKVGESIGTGADSRFYRIRVFDRGLEAGRHNTGDWHAEFRFVQLADVAALPDVH